MCDACCYCCCCRYWCPACVRVRPRHSQRVTSQFTDPVVAVYPTPVDVSPRSPVVLLLKQLPPNCSTIVVACQPSPPDVISGSGVGEGDTAACCEDCGRSASVRGGGAMLMTPRHGRRRSGSGYASSARGSPLSGHARRASGPRTAAYFSPFVRPRTGSDGTCATCVAASSLGSSSCSVAIDVGGPHAGSADGRAARRSWFRHIGIGDSAWRVRRRDSVAVYEDRCSATSDTARIMPSAPSLSRLPPSYSSICVTSWTQQQQQPLSGPRGTVPSSSLSMQTELKAVEWKSFEDI